MASLYTRQRSPYWWIKCRDARPNSPTLGQVIRYSTRFKVGIGPDTRRAQQLRAELTLAEAKTEPRNDVERWDRWATDYLKAYCRSPRTLERYLSTWRTLRLFLDERQILFPRQLTRAHCLSYPAWRSIPDKRAGKYHAIHNTALLELRVLSLLMQEAVQRSYAEFNPARSLGIHRQRPREKPEFTDENLAFIQKAIAKEKPKAAREFFEISSAIARYQGCRLNETHLNPMTDVDINAEGTAGLIRFHIKGGRDHTAPLHPKLIPLFQRLRSQKRTETYSRPPNPSRKWFDFMKRIGLREKLPGACFHCFRVTAVTRLARSQSVSESRAMRFIGHASTTVHRTYQRLRTDDLGDCLRALD